MAWRILGQTSPTGGELTPLFITPPDKQVTISSLSICNRSTEDTRFRIAIIPDSATLADQHYLYYNELVRGNRTFIATIGITLQEGAAIWVYSGNGQLTAQAFGVEVDADPEE